MPQPTVQICRPAGQKKSLILIVEDDAAIRDFLRTALSGAGYRLHEAITGEEALCQLPSERRRIW